MARYRRERTPMKWEWPDRQRVLGSHHSPRIDMRPASRPRHHDLSKRHRAAPKVARYRRERTPMEREWPDQTCLSVSLLHQAFSVH